MVIKSKSLQALIGAIEIITHLVEGHRIEKVGNHCVKITDLLCKETMKSCSLL